MCYSQTHAPLQKMFARGVPFNPITNTMTTSPPPRGRPRDPERMKRVLEAAAQQFCTLGFERTSMGAVALAAGVSKVTIYSYFPSKELLFEAAVGSYTDQVFANLPPEILDPQQPALALSRIGEQFLQLIHSDAAIGIFRALLGSAGQQNSACQLFYRRGPHTLTLQVAHYLQQAQQAGTLTLNDPIIAADQFLSLLMGCSHLQSLFGVATPSQEQQQQILQQGVSFFLNACSNRSETSQNRR